MKWINRGGIVAALILCLACFLEWITIPSRSLVITGIDATGTSFGKPGLVHLVLAPVFIIFSLISRIWCKRSNLAVTAINTAWAFRNYFVISTCYGGICPEKQVGLYLVLISSVMMLIASFFPDVKLNRPTSANN